MAAEEEEVQEESCRPGDCFTPAHPLIGMFLEIIGAEGGADWCCSFRHAGSEIACCAGDLEDLEGVLLILVLLGHQGDIYIGEDPSIP